MIDIDYSTIDNDLKILTETSERLINNLTILDGFLYENIHNPEYQHYDRMSIYTMLNVVRDIRAWLWKVNKDSNDFKTAIEEGNDDKE